MCRTIYTYDCTHQITQRTPCHTPPKSQKPNLQKPLPKTPSFWRTLFCGLPTPSKSSKPCPKRTSKQTVFSACPSCHSRATKELLRIQQEQDIKAKKAREKHNMYQGERMRREGFRCSRCVIEQRRPDQMTRAANSGLCCARGLEEFSMQERGNGGRGLQRSSSSRPYYGGANAQPERMTSREERFPMLRYMTSTEIAREDARAAANSYGWDRRRMGSVDLEPGLVSGYVNGSGAGTSALATPAPNTLRRLPPSPYDVVAGIDLGRWNQISDVRHGSHGRVPPPPNRPLPVPPLRTRPQERMSGPPTPFARNSPRFPPSPVSPMSPPRQQPLRSQSSIMRGELNDMINDTLLDYQANPRYTAVQWPRRY